MSGSPALLSIPVLKKNFNTRRLLDITGLHLQAGSIYALTGDNGSGKSTLLRILAGLEPADTMQCRFDNRSFSNADGPAYAAYPANWRRNIIYVHQHPYLFNTSVSGNIEYGLKMRGVSHEKRRELVKEAVIWAGLQQVAQVAPKHLSGGEKQKVALARAKVLSPRVLLVDEPTANLDRAARIQIVDLLQQTASANNCVVVACHDREIIDLPDVVIVVAILYFQD